MNFKGCIHDKRCFHFHGEQWEEEQKRLENYVRGGLEIIDEIFVNCHSYEAICNAIYDLKDQIGL